MFTWLLKKRGSAASIAASTLQAQRQARSAEAAAAEVSLKAAAEAAAKAERSAASKARAAEAAQAEWAPRLTAARGDDAALLQLAQTAPLLDIKLAAVEALQGEAALKQAEREFRSHDRRVHRVAKQRFEAAVAQREARLRAEQLIVAAESLTQVAVVPANTLVTLDHDWDALKSDLLEPAQRSRFADLRECLNAALREHGEQQQRARDAALAQRQAALDAAQAAQAAAEVAPQPTLAQHSAEVDADGAAREGIEAAETGVADVATDLAAEVSDSPVPDVIPEAPPKAKAKAKVKPKPATAEQRQALEARLLDAEAALAEGQSTLLQQHLKALDAQGEALAGHVLPEALRTRVQALHTEAARLKGWQQWGGVRARDELTAEAEALARLTLAAAQPDGVKLALKAHADAIQTLRQRWKALDRTGAAAPQALWQRFDAALQTAYQPLAEQQAALKAARAENLKARETLLDELESWAEAATDTGDTAAAEADVGPTSEPVNEPANDPVKEPLKDRLRALDRFHTAWRQLGPLEHTVPAAARSGLQQRLERSIERVEAPLLQARRVAQAEREQLVIRAEALAQASAAPQRDAALRVRELQAEWQQHARSLPLARGVEAALWNRFKTATDAVFAQREAAFSARDAEWAANLAEREALLRRLTDIDAATPEADIRRILTEVDRAWRQAGEVPRNAVAGLETRLRDAHAAAIKHLADGAQQRWQAQCDAVIGKLALCEEREQAEPAADDALAARWAVLSSAQPPLPAAWDRALTERFVRALPIADSGPGADVDTCLLQLEAAYELPTAPQYQAARREWKLRALKEALEGRRAAEADGAGPDQWLAAVLGQRGLMPAQRERLQAFLVAWRALPRGGADTSA